MDAPTYEVKNMSEYYAAVDAAITVVSVVFTVGFATAIVVWTWIIFKKLRGEL